MTPTCTWIGASGARYQFRVLALPVSLEPGQVGKLHLRPAERPWLWVPIYIGEGDLAERSGPGHHKAWCIRQKGATHFHCHLNPDQHARWAEERDLLANHANAYVPYGCNERLTG